jgi:predicted nuclease of predicted toxin-antitoxin system
MLRLLADENLDGNILRGLRRRPVDLDAVRVQDLPIAGAGDPEVLRWSADAGRILVTHDVQTITRFAFERVRRACPCPGSSRFP